MTNQNKFTVSIQNILNGSSYCENEFETREEAAEFMNTYPDIDNVQYRVIEIGSEQ